MTDPAASSPTTGGAAGSRFRLLVVTTQSVGPAELREELGRHAGGRAAEVRIVSPAVVETPFQHAAGAVDDGIQAAYERLTETARQLSSEDVSVESYAIGDSDPMLAIEDALRTAPADEILLVTRPEEGARWMEADLFDRARKQLDQPITHVTTAGDGEVHETEHSGPGADEPESAEIDPPTDNLPRFTVRDTAGIAVAIFGTVALAVLASNCISEPADTRSSACVAQILIAGVTALINIAHVIGLLLFTSVGYRGVGERFFAHFSAIGTPAAIAAVLVIGALD